MKKKLYTVQVFAKLNTKRFFRDKLALFFGILFPLIFLFIFGGLNSRSSDINFSVAVINQSKSQAASQLADSIKKNKTFKVDPKLTDFNAAKEKMVRNQLDAAIVLPANFGAVKNGLPSGQAEVYFTQNSAQAGSALTSVLNGVFDGQNAKVVTIQKPFTAVGKPIADSSLSSFDYAFAGLLGFSIIGMGIFGPVNVFPELKKQGILRRLHTTPIKVWQYFLATVISQAAIGLVSISVMFAVAISVFKLHVTGNYLEIALFTVISISLILGIGLAIGGWAKNERQAAPLSNIVVFPLMFLSGTFFPRYIMPEWLQHVSAFLPLTPVIDGLRLLTTEGQHLVNLGAQLGLMGLWLVIIYAIAFRSFRWE